MSKPKEPISQTRLAPLESEWTPTSRKPYCVFTRADDGTFHAARAFFEYQNALDYADGLARLNVLSAVYTNKGGTLSCLETGQKEPRERVS